MYKLLYSIIFFLLAGINVSYAQDTKVEYRKFMKGEIEYQTNGVDTICIIDPMPEYKGGETKMYKFIHNNMKYPRSARKDNITGIVIVNFTVAKSGEVINVRIYKGIREDLDNEALRIFSKMPKWKPGQQSGRAVPVTFTIPINFVLK